VVSVENQSGQALIRVLRGWAPWLRTTQAWRAVRRSSSRVLAISSTVFSGEPPGL